MPYILLVTYPGRKKQAAPPISGCRGMDLQKDRRMMMRTKEEITQTIKEQFDSLFGAAKRISWEV